jgi:lipopolysaccharide exporter
MRIQPPKTEDSESQSFLSDALKLTSAPIITQIIGFFVIPLITRLYPPESFGLAAAYNSIVVIFGAIVTFSYNGAIILSKNNIEKNNLFALSLLITFIVSIISFLFIIPLSNKISTLTNTPSLDHILWMTPISVLVWGVMQSVKSFNIRERKFANIAISAISNVFANNGLVITVGYVFSPYNATLIYGQLVGGVINTLILFREFSITKINTILRTVSIEQIRVVAKDHKQFAFIATPQGLIARLINEIPTYILLYYFSSSVLGFYALGMRILKIPMNLISSSISEVFFQREGPKSKIDPRSLEKTLSFLFIAGNFPFLVLGISGDVLTSFVFGSTWLKAGIYMQILSPYIFFTYMTSLSLSVMVIMRKQQYNLIFQMVNGLTMLICFIIGGSLKNEILAFGLYSIFGSLSYLLYAFYSFSQVSISIGKLFQNIRSYLILSLSLLSVLIAMKLFHMKSNIVLLADFATLTIYYLYVFATQEDLKQLVLSVLKRNSKAA